MSAWVAIILLVAALDLSVIAVFLYLARRGPLVDDEPIGEAIRSPPPTIREILARRGVHPSPRFGDYQDHIEQQQEEPPAKREDYVRLVPRDLFVLALAVLLVACTPAAAQQAPKACGAHDHITGQLTARYHEDAISIGLQSNGHVIQVYASSTGATWTIISTRPDGLTCVVVAGEWWREMPSDLPIGMAR